MLVVVLDRTNNDEPTPPLASSLGHSLVSCLHAQGLGLSAPVAEQGSRSKLGRSTEVLQKYKYRSTTEDRYVDPTVYGSCVRILGRLPKPLRKWGKARHRWGTFLLSISLQKWLYLD